MMGHEVLRQLRLARVETPILILSCDWSVMPVPSQFAGHLVARKTKGPPSGGPWSSIASAAPDQRLENWKLRRAFALPYFLRSTTRASRVRKPPCFRIGRNSGS